MLVHGTPYVACPAPVSCLPAHGLLPQHAQQLLVLQALLT
jgi:hypothetical protein